MDPIIKFLLKKPFSYHKGCVMAAYKLGEARKTAHIQTHETDCKGA